MSFKRTLFWLGVALALSAAIFLARRQARNRPAAPAGNFPKIEGSKIQMAQVRPGRGLEIRAVRTNGVWRLIEPLDWPAQQISVDEFLAAIEKISPAARITPAEVRARPAAEKEYGFDDPKASIILHGAGIRVHFLVGSPTAPGDQFFLQVVGTEGVFVIGSDFLKLIPSSVNDWRDRALVDMNRLQADRVSVTNAGRTFSFQRNRPGPWRLVSPLNARADQARIHDALEKIHSLRTQTFVSDDPQEDLEPFGLQPPVIDLGLERDGAPAAHLLFGKSVSNLVYARRGDWHSVVTVQNEFVSDWQRPINEFRDPFVVSEDGPLQSISHVGAESFEAAWSSSGSWVLSPSNWPGDADLVKEFILAVNALRVEQFVKDVVTPADLPAYGLDTPLRQFILRHQTLDQSGTNIVELRLGATNEGRIYARRADEESVYAIGAAAALALPSRAWQLRERRIWNFRVEEVRSVSYRHGARVREIQRKGEQKWSLAPGSQGVINDLAVDETMRALASAAVDRWSALGEEQTAAFGISEATPRIVIELINGQRLTARFGNSTPSNGVFAAVVMDGQTWTGEFPWVLCRDIVTHIAPPNDQK